MPLQFDTNLGSNRANLELVLALLPVAFEVDIYLGDRELLGRSIIEWGFLHVRRALAVDIAARDRWSEAFSKDEPAVEKLGAVHLLGRGIYAFKATGAGAATDLVLGATGVPAEIRSAERARAGADGLEAGAVTR